MSEKLGNVSYARDPQTFVTGPNLPSPPHERDYAEKTAATVDEEVRAIVEKEFQRALDLLKERRAAPSAHHSPLPCLQLLGRLENRDRRCPSSWAEGPPHRSRALHAEGPRG